jgi:hypothetical protein
VYPIAATLSKPLYVYEASTNELITQYEGVCVASKAMKVCDKTINKYLKSGEVYKGMLFRLDIV